jgi:hypothetical protein
MKHARHAGRARRIQQIPTEHSEGEVMNFITNAMRYQASTMLALLAILGVMVPSAMATDTSSQPTTWETARVIAHLPMTGGAVNEMFLENQNNKQYLFIRQPSKQEFTVIDVTRPDRPSLVNNVTLPIHRKSEELQMISSGLALDETPESAGQGSARHGLSPAGSSAAASGIRPTESVRLLDLTDPKNPKTLQTFNGVTSMLTDQGRNLIYIANGEGLWILRHREHQQMPLCDSEQAFNPIADCQ